MKMKKGLLQNGFVLQQPRFFKNAVFSAKSFLMDGEDGGAAKPPPLHCDLTWDEVDRRKTP